ncbi:MAG: lytic transglycosylase domain-containing protein [Thermobacillus sp.]|uniref:Soluble lytic murein transglycosylase-like protein n=1 Tax=Thermobacillus composti (strain DSM 18247 / JCM 13945 / KWC4) TaxID=717605 RepID=L0ED00_THECK|nr:MULTISPECIES: lytic transglycosylase domain-containing protein [Thermobacillus]AGA57499.1 soluble lytic murein transglycosylase-like protein [Thermobacillus composti KWC4]REK59267.1 MAG: lytic transglycosylase domain-containing protein [Thermobacillus sp.]
MRRRRKRRGWLLAALLLLLAVLYAEQSGWVKQRMYPIAYRDDIRASALSHGVEPHLVAAIIRIESNYKTGRVSSKGALGIMQIMPDTAAWIVEQARYEGVTLDKIQHRADVGIELGTWYLASLLRQFDGNMAAAVAAYNAGPGNVSAWLKEGVWDGTLASSDDIPFGETRRYVQRVIYYYNKYKSIYPDL